METAPTGDVRNDRFYWTVPVSPPVHACSRQSCRDIAETPLHTSGEEVWWKNSLCEVESC